MTQSDKQEPNKPSDDVKQSFAWGQLFAGSLIGGLAVWKLLHKMTNTEPSEWFWGLSAGYDEWRDWLTTPFQWLQVQLTADEKSAVVVCTVMLATMLRTEVRYLGGFGAVPLFASAAMTTIVAAFLAFAEFVVRGHLRVPSVGALLLLFAAMLVINGIFLPIVGILSDRANLPRQTLYLLVSTTATICWGTALLLLNWATS